jgi:hypothetical protein
MDLVSGRCPPSSLHLSVVTGFEMTAAATYYLWHTSIAPTLLPPSVKRDLCLLAQYERCIDHVVHASLPYSHCHLHCSYPTSCKVGSLTCLDGFLSHVLTGNDMPSVVILNIAISGSSTCGISTRWSDCSQLCHSIRSSNQCRHMRITSALSPGTCYHVVADPEARCLRFVYLYAESKHTGR